jgi:hypothetical protein
MKKIFIILAIGVAATLSSCLKDAEVTSSMTQASKDQLTSDDPIKMYEAALVSQYVNMQSYVYSNLSHNYFGQKSFDYLTSLMGNDMCMTGQYGMSLYHYILDYWQRNYAPSANRWKQYYQHITEANIMLEDLAKAEVTPQLSYFKAAALTARAYAYLHLAYLYGLPYYMGAEDTIWGMNTVYSGSNADAPCVPLMLEGDQATKDREATLKARATVGEVMTQTVKDLEGALELYAAAGKLHTADTCDFDGMVAANYLMRAHMLMHEWKKAEDVSKLIVDNVPLATAAQLMQGFSDISLPNIVMGCDITADNSGIYMSWFSQMDMFGAGYAAIGVARVAHNYLVESISDTDIRLDWFWTKRNLNKLAAEFGQVYAQYYYQACKFIGAGREVVFGNWHLGDYIYLRSEEAHFCLAEIYAHQNKLDDAVAVLSNVMAIRDAQYAYAGAKTKAAVISEINLQKRIEFWGEGLEYLDNRRLNIPVNRALEGTNHIAWAQGYWPQEAACYLYQIPQSEVDNNKMIEDKDNN